MKVTCDHVATVQFQASDDDVYVKLSILDHETEVTSRTGQGHIVIPVFCFSATDGVLNGHKFGHTCDLNIITN